MHLLQTQNIPDNTEKLQRVKQNKIISVGKEQKSRSYSTKTWEI